jgi:hypothetical protein
MTPRRWVVPIVPGPIDETVIVEVRHPDRVRVVYTVLHEERALPVLTAPIACQVGQAVQDASKYCGELRDAADALASRRRLVKRVSRQVPG